MMIYLVKYLKNSKLQVKKISQKWFLTKKLLKRPVLSSIKRKLELMVMMLWKKLRTFLLKNGLSMMFLRQDSSTLLRLIAYFKKLLIQLIELTYNEPID